MEAAWPAIPRILASVDRNAFGPSYGCCDRQYWHYRTAAFASEMYQEAALPLAQAFALALPGNRWFGQARLAEAAVAVLRFSARSARRDASCDDYYPHERALGAAVFSLQAATETYALLKLDDVELLRFFERRAEWIAANDESGRLTNHHALAALALWRTARLTDREDLRIAALCRTREVVQSQHAEGWFPEYDGADPGYQTVTIDCLAKLRRAAGLRNLDEPLRRAVEFARWFLHPDDGYGGEYGSRGTRHFYPHGCELLAGESAAAADLADGFLRALRRGTAAEFADDRMYVHRIANLIEAYVDWSPERAVASEPPPTTKHFPAAGLYVTRDSARHAIISTARGGVFHDYRVGGGSPDATIDAGLVVELDDGRTAVSQTHASSQATYLVNDELTVTRPLDEIRFERATPFKQAALHLGMCLVGRFGRLLARRWLQRRVIAGRRKAPVRLTRRFRFIRDSAANASCKLRVTDVVELTTPQVRVRRMAFAADLQAAYTAAAQVYQAAMLHPWRDLAEFVDALNAERRVVIERILSAERSS